MVVFVTSSITPDGNAWVANSQYDAIRTRRAVLKVLVDRKYRRLFSFSSHRRKPGPEGPSAELIAAIVEMKRRNPRFGCVRIAQQTSHALCPPRARRHHACAARRRILTGSGLA